MGRIIAILLLLPIVYFGALLAASEMGGEVVTLETEGSKGSIFATPLWIVDFDRASWIRASEPDADWLARVRAEPLVFLTRNGQRTAYRAEVFEELRQQVNKAMREKYGRADELVSTWHDPEKVVAVRLIEQ